MAKIFLKKDGGKNAGMRLYISDILLFMKYYFAEW